MRHMGLIPELGRFPGGGDDNPLQYSYLKNSMDRRAWWTTVHRVAESDRTEHAHTLHINENIAEDYVPIFDPAAALCNLL